MATADSPSGTQQATKTLAFRITPELHAQFSAIVQLKGSTLNTEGPIAITAYIETMRSDPEVQAKAQASRRAFEQEMAARQGAIDTLFGTPSSKESSNTKARSTRKGSNGGSAEN